jgi:hypothetical protein
MRSLFRQVTWIHAVAAVVLLLAVAVHAAPAGCIPRSVHNRVENRHAESQGTTWCPELVGLGDRCTPAASWECIGTLNCMTCSGQTFGICAYGNCAACASDGTCTSCSPPLLLSGGHCVSLLANGATCSGASQCSSGTCTGSVCCAYNNCQACDGGTCSACNPASYYLNGGQCLSLKPNGGSCSSGGECSSSTCTGSVCCAYGNCATCNGGTCSACNPASYYLSGGQCLSLKSNGVTCSSNNECGSDTCQNVCCAYTNCQVCTGGTCSACNTASYYLNGGQCLALKPNGESCSAADQCRSDICLGNVCCAYSNCQSCAGGTCSACDPANDYLSGGQCHPLKGNSASCSSSNECSSGTCTGSVCCSYSNCQACVGGTCSACNPASYYLSGGQCLSLKPNGGSCSSNVVCGSATCTDSVCCAYSNCQACSGGAGACSACDSARYYLSGGQCLTLQANGVSCSAGTHCSSGLCATRCCQWPGCATCDSDGRCETCANPTTYRDSTGHCVVPSNPGGACEGDAQCTTHICRQSTCCASSPCAACSSGANNGVCTQCPGTHYLGGSICVPKTSNGATCSAGLTCLSGNCVAGVCCAYANCTTCNSDGCATCDVATEYLSSAMVCLEKKPSGSTCAAATECKSGVCTRSRCCRYDNCAECAHPTGGCTACSTTLYVNAAQQCTPQLGFGASCTFDAMCLSSHCASNQCCLYDSCLACSASTGGKCTSCSVDRYLTADSSTCVLKGTDGATCSGNGTCLSNYCGVSDHAPVPSGSNQYCCTSPLCNTCSSANAGACTSCITTYYISPTGCVPKKKFGRACAADFECLVGVCTTAAGAPRLCCSTAACAACDAATGVCNACIDSQYLTPTGTCLDKKASGGQCNGDQQCLSSTCATDKCCGVGNCTTCDTSLGMQYCTECRFGYQPSNPFQNLGYLRCDAKTPPGDSCSGNADCFYGTCIEQVCCRYMNCSLCRAGNGVCTQCSDSTQYIATTSGACLAKKTNGSHCSRNVECTSDQCVGNRCCAYDNCLACDSPADGHCTSCISTNYIDSTGQCAPKIAAGAACPGDDAACFSGLCAGRVCCESNAICARCSNPSGDCVACPSGYFLAANGSCLAQYRNGAACSADVQCSSSQCIARRCCSASISTSCAACDDEGERCVDCPKYSRLAHNELECLTNSRTLKPTATWTLSETASETFNDSETLTASPDSRSDSHSIAITDTARLTDSLQPTDSPTVSNTATYTDTATLLSSQSVTISETSSLPLPPRPVPLDEGMRTAVTVLESTTTVVGALASPAAALQMARVKGTMDMVKRCRSEQQGDTEHLKQSSGFPSSFLPFLHFGSAEGQYMRGAVIANVVAVPILSVVVVALGAVARALKLVRSASDKVASALQVPPRSPFRSVTGIVRMPGSVMVISSAVVYGLVSSASTLYDSAIDGALDIFLASVALIFVLAVMVVTVAHMRRTVRDHVSLTQAIVRRRDGRPLGRLARVVGAVSGRTAWFARDDLIAVQSKSFSTPVDASRQLEDHVALESWGMLVARYRGTVLTRRPSHHGPPDAVDFDDEGATGASQGFGGGALRIIETAATYFFAIDFVVTCVVALGEGLAATDCSRGLAVSVVGNTLGFVCAALIRPYNAALKNVLVIMMNALLAVASFVTVGAIRAETQADADALATIANGVAMAAAAFPFAAIVLSAVRVALIRFILRAETVPAIARRRQAAATVSDVLTERMLLNDGEELQEVLHGTAGGEDPGGLLCPPSLSAEEPIASTVATVDELLDLLLSTPMPSVTEVRVRDEGLRTKRQVEELLSRHRSSIPLVGTTSSDPLDDLLSAPVPFGDHSI